MNTVKQITPVLSSHQLQAIENACSSIAPSWPLDENIAVNPYWNMRHESFEQVGAKLSALGNIQTLMPASYYMEQYQNGTITQQHLKQAAQSLGLAAPDKNLLRVVKKQSELFHWHNVSDLLDVARENKVAWRDEITHQVSQFCAAYFQYDGPLKPIHDQHQAGFYQTWLNVIQGDKGIAILMGEPKLNQYFLNLPHDELELFAQAIEELGIDDDTLEYYLQSLLLDINGWAAWVAYKNFHQNQADNGATLFNFLAIRLAWELVLWRYYNGQTEQQGRKLRHQWGQEKAIILAAVEQHKDAYKHLWVWQKAMEIAYQTSFVNALHSSDDQANQPLTPKVQAVFCIDVRSEVMRRALEQQSPYIQTFGFAGFFGMPLSYSKAGSQLSRPQLPGLIKAPYQVEQEAYNIDVTQAKQAAQLNKGARFQYWASQPSSTFSMVETGGLLYGFKLLKQAFSGQPKTTSISEFSKESYWSIKQGHRPITFTEKLDLIANALTGIGLTQSFAEQIFIAGHASEGTNNPHQHGLNCGACGGQSGELNVRVFCQLANDERIREALKNKGINIPGNTRFIPLIHNTTTDELQIQDETVVTDELSAWFEQAQSVAQKERAEGLGLLKDDPQLAEKILKRGYDWSQVRAEWGLANNAAFVIAPRRLTAHLNLQGRAFLHDYDYEKDHDATVLNSIMSAPMIVTNWINMQYNASVLDNAKYGSGNKVLHNVVGGNIGVFEGNGGDLRIGLSKQSIHNGEKWMHQPLRLSVFIAAPCEAIEGIIHGNQDIKYLVENDWLYILQVDPKTRAVQVYQDNTWQAFAAE